MSNIEITDNGILIATLYGELDNHEANRIRTHISSSIFTGQVRALLEFRRLGFMDSAGIGLILGRMRDLAPVNGETLILNPTVTMEKIFVFRSRLKHRHCTVETAIEVEVVHEQ